MPARARESKNETRSTPATASRRWTWPDWIYALSAQAVWSVGLTAAVVSRWLGQAGVIHPVFVVCSALGVAGHIVALAGYCALGDDAPAIGIGISTLRMAFKLAAVVLSEARIVDVYFLGGAVWALAQAVVYAYVVGEDPCLALEYTVESSTLLEILIGLWSRLARARALRHARRLVLADRARYDRIWASISSGGADAAGLLEVARQASQLQSACREPCGEEVRQAVLGKEADAAAPPPAPGGGAAALGAVAHLGFLARMIRGPAGPAGPASPACALPPQAQSLRLVTSLDQLYVQVRRPRVQHCWQRAALPISRR